MRKKWNLTNFLSAMKRTPQCRDTLKSYFKLTTSELKLHSQNNSVGMTFKPRPLKRLFHNFSTGDRAIRFDKASVNWLSLRAINWNNTSGHVDITVFFANLICSFPVALLVRANSFCYTTWRVVISNKLRRDTDVCFYSWWRKASTPRFSS